MKKITLNIIITLFIFLMFIIQIFLINPNNIFGAKPNILLITVLVTALRGKMLKSSIYALLMGIILDLIYSSTFGIYTICYTITSVIIALINFNYRKDSKESLIYITLIGTVIFEVLVYIIYIIMNSLQFDFIYLLLQTIMVVILNIALSFILFNVFDKLFTKYSDNKELY